MSNVDFSSGGMDALYKERAMCVSLIIKMARALGLTVGMKIDSKEGEEWPVVFVDLPSGQVSWHINRNDYDNFFGLLPEYKDQWDGHDTAAKYYRVLNPDLGDYNEPK